MSVRGTGSIGIITVSLCKPREVREFSVFSRLFFPAAIWKGRINGTTLDRAGHQRIETSGSTIFRAEDRRTDQPHRGRGRLQGLPTEAATAIEPPRNRTGHWRRARSGRSRLDRGGRYADLDAVGIWRAKKDRRKCGPGSKLLNPEVVGFSSRGDEHRQPAWCFASSRPSLGRIVRVSILRFNLRVGPTLRDVSRRPAELATKLVKLVLKPVLFVFQFSIQDLDNPLVKVPEVVKLHLL
jgi:hypothetical protein